MTDNNKNLVMVDFSDRDPRSFKAHLRGAGDGRQSLYSRMFKANGNGDLDTLNAKFTDKVWAMSQARSKAAAGKQVIVTTSMLPRLAVAVVGLLLGVMLYQAVVGV